MQVSAGSAAAAWAVGYDGGAGVFRTFIQRWNGSTWAVVRSRSPSRLDNVLVGVDTLSRTSAWAVGYDSVNVFPNADHRPGRRTAMLGPSRPPPGKVAGQAASGGGGERALALVVR